MKKIFSSFLFACLFIAISCSVQKKYFSAPLSDLGHIDFVLDSADFFAFKEDSFLNRDFGAMFIDTTEIQGEAQL